MTSSRKRYAATGLALTILALVVGLSACQDPATTVICYSVTYNGNGSNSGVVPVDSSPYAAGASVTVLSPGSLAYANRTFLGWATSASATAAEYQSGARIAMPASNLTLYAVWSLNRYTLKYYARSGGTIEGVKTQSVEFGSSGSAVTAVPESERYVFAGWSDGGTTASRVDTNVTSDRTLIASFTCTDVNPMVEITATYVAGPNGGISGSSVQTFYSGLSATTVTAVPDAGYAFAGWSDGVTTASRTDGPLYADLSVTATFKTATFTLAYLAAPNGSLSGSTTQTVDYLGDGTAVTAVPDAGYSFAGWSDGNDRISRTDIDVVKNLSVTAFFSKNQLILIDFTAIKDETIDLSADDDKAISISKGQSLAVSVAGSWDGITWYLDGAALYASDSSYTVYPYSVSVGVHTLTVVATRNGVPYSTMLRFRAVY